MPSERVFQIARFMQPADGEPIRSIVTESPDASIVAWHVRPGQRIQAHVHPQGQDSWTVVSGTGLYQTDAHGTTVAIGAGDVVIAPKGCVHGVLGTGTVPLVFISIVSPAAAGFELL